MNTPLHFAIQNGNIEIVKTLLAGGCNLGERNADGLTPLDLATMLNNEEIVRLLLEHGAGYQSPPLTWTLDVPQRKKRITFWFALTCVVLGVAMLGSMAHDLSIGVLTSDLPHREVHRTTALVDAVFALFFLPLFIAYLFCYFFFLLRLWEEVPQHFARTTPGMAAGLSLIPIFGWYWMFVALGGLYQDMNRTLEHQGEKRRFNTTLIMAACVIWLIYYLFSLMVGMVMGVTAVVDIESPVLVFGYAYSFMTSLAFGVFTVVMYWIIRNNVIAFADIRSNARKSCNTMQAQQT